jgi:autotransporter-associated beta strand protein
MTWNKNGTGSVTDGAGTWNTTSTNWYNGTTNVVWNSADSALFGSGGAGGTVALASGGITAAGLTFNTVTAAYNISGTSTAVLTLSSPTIQDSTASTITSIISAPIAGTSGLNINISSGATLALSGTNTFTGGTTVNGGFVNFYSDASFGAVPGTAGTNITLTGGAAIDYALGSGTTTLNANRGIAVGNGSGGGINCFSGRTLTYGGVISNVTGQIGNFSVNSVGTLILTGNSTYSGTTTITAGTTKLGVANALPTTTTLVFNDTTYAAGTLDLYGNNQTVAGLSDTSTNTRFITNSNTGTSTLTVAGPGSFGGVIENTGGTKLLALTKSGSGTLTLNAANTYSGATSITGGTLALGASGSISNSATIYVGSGATFDVSANSSYAVGSAQTLTGVGSVNGSFSFGAGTINPGTVGTAGTLTFNNGVTLNGGGLSFDLSGASNTSGGGINDLISVTGALSLNAVTPVSVSFSGTPAVGTTYTVLTSGSETGSGSFLAQQHGYTISNTTPGVITITYVGGPAVANQVWSSTSSSSWDVNTSPNWFNTDSSTNDNFFSGDNVTFNDSIPGVQTSITLSTSVAPGSMIVNSNTSNYTFTSLNSSTGKITGTTGLTKLGSSTLTMATALNDYTGVTNISGGILNVASLALINTASSIGKGSAAGSAGDLILNGGTLQYTGTTAQTTNRLLTLGTAGGTIDGSGSGTGAVVDFSGTGPIAFLGSGPHTLNLVGTGGTGNAVTTANTFAPVIGDGSNGSTSVVVNNPGGWWAITGTNTFTGGVNVSGGTLVYAADANFGAAPATPTPNNIILNGATLNQSVNGTIILNSNRGIGLGNSGGTIQTFSGKTLAYGGIIADAPGSSGGTLTKDSVGTLILSGSSTYSGNTNMLAGTLQLGVSNALPTTTTLNFVNTTYPAYFDLNGFNQTIGGLNDSTTLAAHYITNSNTGTATLTVNGSGTYNGILQDGGSGKILALTKSGPGTLTLAANNNYSGPTYVTGGTLALAGGAITTSPLISVGTGAVLDINGASTQPLGSSQTLIGNGSINGTMNFNAGTINPGTVGTAGTLTFNNDLNANGGLIQLDLSAASNVSGGGINDLINITGSLNVNGVTPISVTFTGTPARGTEYWVITSGGESGTLSNLIAYQPGYTVDTSVSDKVGIIFTGAAGANNLVWNSSSSSNWDIGLSQNWFNLGTSANDVFFSGDNVTFNDSSGVQTSINLTTALAPGSMQVSSNTNNYTFSGSGKITGSTGLVKSGTSTLTLNTLNDYTGVTLINGGIVNVAGLGNVNQPSSIGAGSANGSSGDLVLNGGTLQYTGSANQTTNRLLSIGTAGGTIDSSGSGTLTFNGTGAIGFNSQTGPRTLTLTGNNATASVFAPVIGDNGGPTSLVKSGVGTWDLNGSNTFTGPVTVTGGTLVMNTSDLNLGAVPATATPGAIVLNGGAIADNIAGTTVLSTNRGIELGTAGGGLDPFYNKTLSYGGIISDLPGNTGALIKDSLGTLILSGNSTYSGSTTINSGTIQLNVSNALPTTITLAFNDLTYQNPNSTLNLAGFSQTVSGLSDDSIYPPKITSTASGLAVLTVNGGGNFNGVISDGGIGNQVALTKGGSAALILAGTNNYSGGTTINSGVLVCASGLAAVGSGNVTINAGGAIFQNSSPSAVFALVQSGYNGGEWNGTGINSASASGDATYLHAIGMYQPSSSTTFEGLSLGTGDVAVKYTYYGDANLDGKVDSSDYTLIDNGFLNHLTGWQNGDFNYDGVVNGSDYTLIDNAFNTQGAQIAAAIANPTAQVAGISAVPEPASMGLLSVGAAGLLARRRRRNLRG